MGKLSIWCYLWDLQDEGVEAALDFLGREMGLDAVSPAVAYHSVQSVNPRSRRRRIFTADSSVYFRPTPDYYGQIRPLPHPMVAEEDVLARVAAAAREREMGCVGWTVCLHSSRLAAANPNQVIRNAYGDLIPFALCPSQPAVREFITAQARDLTDHYPLTGLHLEAAYWRVLPHHLHYKVGQSIAAGDLALLSFCFCEACQQRAAAAGVNGERLQAQVRTYLDSALDGGPSACEDAEGEEEQFDALAEALPDLAGYLRMREETVASLLQATKQAAGVEVTVLALEGPRTTGLHLQRVRPLVDRLGTGAYTANPKAAAAATRRVVEASRGGPGPVIGVNLCPPCSPDEATLQQVVDACLREGARDFHFYNYGVLPAERLAWMRRAVERIRAAGE